MPVRKHWTEIEWPNGVPAPIVGFIAQPTPIAARLVYVERLGRYVEWNPALECWRLTADRRYATRFTRIDELTDALARIYDDCCDVWHLTQDDFSVRTV
jgi:hypothetical protein